MTPTIQTIATPDLRRIARAVAWVEKQSATVTEPATPVVGLRDSYLVWNESGFDVPRYGLVELRDMGADDAGREFVRPASPWPARVGIASAPIVDGAVGRVWTSGMHPLRLTGWADLIDVMFPFRIVAQVDSFNGRQHFGTPLLIAYRALDDEPLVLAEIARR